MRSFDIAPGLLSSTDGFQSCRSLVLPATTFCSPNLDFSEIRRCARNTRADTVAPTRINVIRHMWSQAQ
jgi:hypothetical protein